MTVTLHGPWVPPGGLAFIDLETTGGPAQRESITEIGIVEVDGNEVREWSSLVRPGMRISPHVARLTGIDDAMLADAPPFEALAGEVFDRLQGRLLVAHNARFDHGHLRAALRRAGMDFRPRVLCTLKLSRLLFPEERLHGLDVLVERHGLQSPGRHRALGDARLLWQFWQRLHERMAPGTIRDAVRELAGRSTLPPHLDQAALDDMPDAPGVYLFYGENELPLYVGKSLRLRERVMSHFSADHRDDRELSLSQQVRRIDWICAEGEIGALLEEAQLVKRLQPTHNRQLRRNRELCAWRLSGDTDAGTGTGTGPRIELVHAGDLAFGRQDRLYGLFRSRREATERLRALAAEHALCPALLGLEKLPPGRRCFARQLGRCRGACCGDEPRQAHGLRLLEALRGLEVQAWPHEGPVALREGATLHVLDGWRYLGAARDEEQAAALLRSGRPAFDLDIHRILRKAMERLGPPIPLDACAGGSAGARATGGAGGARRRTPAAVPGRQPRASVTPPSTTTVSPTTKSPAREAR
ncbi:3'-5' exonuclease family protein [Quisquiliibacterium transsilvanicum]|uniref:DNA-directed DNA polymerase n=1 Tax=Quisquiliibacterium transsilvanicum TaxID=1549638 RepID=A0A7W8HL23_9BURK|nr:DNA polymerase-3 subunit epsilon [Quisquiliibacterium transsilvanicum]